MKHANIFTAFLLPHHGFIQRVGGGGRGHLDSLPPMFITCVDKTFSSCL